MKKVLLGSTGLQVSRLAFGTGTNGEGGKSDQSLLGIEVLSGLLQKGYRNGVNFWDTADAYGTHPHVAKALETVPRKDVVILTKTMSRQYHGVKGDIERFLIELQTDWIDIVLLHAMTDRRWTEKYRGARDALSMMKKAGRIRSVGVSCHSLGALRATAEDEWADVVMVRMNYKGIHMDSTHKKILTMLRGLHDSGTGIIGMKVFGVGKLASDAKEAIDFVFSLGLIHAVTIGMMDRVMMEENIQNMGD